MAVDPPTTASDADPSDATILTRIASGDRAQLRLLAERHERTLLGLARGLLSGDRTLALDAVQETWMRVLKHAGTFRSDGDARAWLCRILVNRCHDLRPRPTLTIARLDPSDPAPGITGPTEGPTDSPFAGPLQDAIDRLDDDKRDVVLLCYHRGLTHPLAAEVLEIPIGTLKSRLHGAMRELRLMLHEHGVAS